MTKGLNMTRRGKIAACVLIMLAIGTTASFADVMAQINRPGGTVTGMTRYLAASKLYKVEMKSGDRIIKVDIPLHEVISIRVKKPADFDDLAKKVANKQYSAAEAGLEKICKDYQNLEWDGKATALLGEVYVNTGKGAKAVSIFRDSLKANPGVLKEPAFFRNYVAALTQVGGKEAIIKKLINDVIATGARPSVAEAHVLRGDMYMKKGDYKLALIDGYLRNIVLFTEARESRPVALSKAIKCFEQLGESNNAEMMRKMLKKEFPTYTVN